MLNAAATPPSASFPSLSSFPALAAVPLLSASKLIGKLAEWCMQSTEQAFLMKFLPSFYIDMFFRMDQASCFSEDFINYLQCQTLQMNAASYAGQLTF